MRISNNNIDNVGSGSVGSIGSNAGDTRSSSTTTGAKSDSVNLSSAANLIALAKAGAAARQSKIQDLSAQIQSGAYQSDTEQVSRAVVQGHIGG